MPTGALPVYITAQKDHPMHKKISLLAGSIVLAFSAGAQAQTKWDLPSAYPASNFHVENLTNFVRTWIACRAAS